jgi:NTP pyrophosphatase (non-canonical NTP hydrolase)
MIDIDNLANDLHKTAKEKGFWDDNNGIIFYLKQLMMVTTEVAEVAEAMRKSQGDRAVVRELADIIIRTLDLYQGMYLHGYVDHSLDEMFDEKTEYNKTRPEKHGVRF